MRFRGLVTRLRVEPGSEHGFSDPLFKVCALECSMQPVYQACCQFAVLYIRRLNSEADFLRYFPLVSTYYDFPLNF